MEGIKGIFSVIGAIIGVLTGVLTLYAKYIDLKKRASRGAEETQPLVASVAPATRSYQDKSALVVEAVAIADAVRPQPAAVVRAQQIVRGPAIALISIGCLSLVFNLLVIVYGLVSESAAPLATTGTETRKGLGVATLNEGAVPYRPGGTAALESDKASVALAVIMLLCFSVASAAAAWAGFNMLHLRSYWLSVAGSLAIMPGACFCCFAGFPIGIWSLTVLLKPEVSATFH
jgi:hypothetical protein